MNKKLKEQLELVIMQCSALKASLDEALVRNRQYEKEIAILRSKDEVGESTVEKEVLPEPIFEEPETQNTDTLIEAEPVNKEAPKAEPEEEIVVAEEPKELVAEAEPETEPETEMQTFQSVLEIGADMVSQAVSSSKDYIAKLEESHPEGCNSLIDIVRSRTDLFKVEISGIISGAGSIAEKREKMNTALIKLIQYFENVK